MYIDMIHNTIHTLYMMPCPALIIFPTVTVFNFSLSLCDSEIVGYTRTYRTATTSRSLLFHSQQAGLQWRWFC